MSSTPRLGIDFGTSHTVSIVAWPEGRVRPLLFDGSPLLPSAVCADQVSGQGTAPLLVGKDALHTARIDPSRYESSPKRRIDDGTVLLGDQEYSVSALIGAVLTRVREEATRVLGHLPSQVTLSHPAAWGVSRRLILREAAIIAGLGEPSLIPEPVAAARYFAGMLGDRFSPDRGVLVYDFGGGTFDASLILRGSQDYDVRAVDGIDDLGGLDLDELIVNYAGKRLGAEYTDSWQRLSRPNTAEDRRNRRMLWDDARMVKERLSRADNATLHVPLAGVDVSVTRTAFEDLARPLIERTARMTSSVLRWSELPKESLAGIFLVGGSSRIPMVATVIERELGLAPTILEQPELVVAEGALRSGSESDSVNSAPPISAPPISAPPVSATPVSPISPPTQTPTHPPRYVAQAPLYPPQQQHQQPPPPHHQQPPPPPHQYQTPPPPPVQAQAQPQRHIPPPIRSLTPAQNPPQRHIPPPIQTPPVPRHDPQPPRGDSNFNELYSGERSSRVPSAPPYQRSSSWRPFLASVFVIALLIGGYLLFVRNNNQKENSDNSSLGTSETQKSKSNWIPSEWQAFVQQSPSSLWVTADESEGGRCAIEGGNLHVTRSDNSDLTGCTVKPPLESIFSNVAIQSEITVIKGCAGLWVRTGVKGYLFTFCEKSAHLYLLHADPPSKEDNQIAEWKLDRKPEKTLVGVMAMGTTFSIYIDGKQLYPSVSDTILSYGKVNAGGYSGTSDSVDIKIHSFRVYAPVYTPASQGVPLPSHT